MTAVMALMTAIAVPQMLAGLERSRGLAAARYLGARLALARAQAVSRSANVALHFEEDARGIRFGVFVDGNHNGVRAADIQALVDPPIEPPVELSHLFPGVTIGLTPDAPADDAVDIGRSALLSFSPSGTATSGSIYVRSGDGTQWAVRVLGATGRTRVLRYDPGTRDWVHAL